MKSTSSTPFDSPFTFVFGASPKRELLLTRTSLMLILFTLSLAAIGQQPGTNVGPGSGLASLITPDGMPHVFYVGDSQHVFQLSWSSASGWQNQDLTALTGATLAASGSALTSVLQGSISNVFYLDSTGHVQHLSLNGSSWSSEDLTSLTSGALALAGSPVSSIGAATDGMLHVFYVGTDHHIYRMYWDSGNTLHNQDFTGLCFGTPVGSGSGLSAVINPHGNPHVIYLDGRQHVNDAHQGGGGDYGNDDLTFYTGNTPAATGSPLGSMGATTDASASVYYVGTNRHIFRIYWPPTGLTNQDFTALGGGALVADGSGLSTFVNAHGDPHVFYLDNKQHVNDVHRGGAGDYGNDDLTFYTGSTLARSGSALANLGPSGDANVHVFYIASNSHVDRIMWPKTGSLQNQDLMPAIGVSIPTWHGDNARQGLNSSETTLTPANVNASTFGKLFSYLVDGYMYAQPLYVANLTVGGAKHNVVFAATERATVYAFDADVFGTGAPLWKTSLLQSGETPQPGGNPKPYQGLTSTPVIDLAANIMYVVSSQQQGTNPSFFRLHALDITTGQERAGSPVVIHASVPGTNSNSVNGVITLTPACLQRAALLLSQGTLYLGFSACHEGWMLSYDAATLTQLGMLNMSPNVDGYGQFGGAGGVWMGGGGPAADDQGNVYISTGNGFYDGGPEWGDSVLKLDSHLNVIDHFTPADWAYLQCTDKDLSAGGVMLLPGQTQLLNGGKAGKMYLINTGSMGGIQANDAGAAQTFWFYNHFTASCVDNHGNTVTGQSADYSFYATAAWFNGSAYLGADPGGVKQLIYSGGQFTLGLEAPDSIPPLTYGTTPFISANGSSNGIVWALDHGQPIQAPNSSTPTSAVLRAYDAADVTHVLYNSSQNAADIPGFGIKFTSPIVANGRVFIGTAHDSLSTANPQGQLDVYGLK